MNTSDPIRFWAHDKDNPDLAGAILMSFVQRSDYQIGLQWAQEEVSEKLLNYPGVASAAGLLALGAEDFDYALARFELVQRARPQDVDASYNLALAQHGLQDYEGALATTKSVERSWVDCEAIYLLNARCQHHLGMMDEAVESVQEFLKQHPNHNQASGLLALISLDAGELDRAESLASSVIARAPEQFEAHLALAGSLVAQQDLDKAMAAVAKAKEQYPDVGRLYENAGQIALLHMDFETAITEFEEAVRLMPDHIGSWHLLGWNQILLEDLDGAAKSFESALLLNRNFAESHGGVAVVDAMRGRDDLASKSVRRARALDPNNISGRFAESLILRKDGKSQEADAIIDDLFKTETGTAIAALMPALLERIDATGSSNKKN